MGIVPSIHIGHDRDGIVTSPYRGMKELIPNQIVGTTPRHGRGGDLLDGLGIERADAGMVLLPTRRGGVGVGVGSGTGHGLG